jgi:DNA-binding LacI/PurR family transcriptional regulator
MFDDFQVGYLATSHLIDLGHTRIGLISGEPNHPLAFSVPGLRLAGYTAALARHGIRVDPGLEQSGRFTAPGGRNAMERLLALDDPPTAVFVMSDEMAFGAWRAIRDAGLSWPDDVAVIGVDDHELAEMVDLSTIRLVPRTLGRAAARGLLAAIDDRVDEGGQLEDGLEPIEIVLRGSTVGSIDQADRAV